MNVLIVNPANKPYTNRFILAEPLDVLQIATIIEKKFNNVKVIDMDVNRMDNNINNNIFSSSKRLFQSTALPRHFQPHTTNIYH